MNFVKIADSFWMVEPRAAKNEKHMILLLKIYHTRQGFKNEVRSSRDELRFNNIQSATCFDLAAKILKTDCS